MVDAEFNFTGGSVPDYFRASDTRRAETESRKLYFGDALNFSGRNCADCGSDYWRLKSTNFRIRLIDFSCGGVT